MLLSRFWYLILAVTAAGAVAAAMLAQGIVNTQSIDAVDEQLRRDRLELEAMLRLDARSRLDRIAFASIDPKLARLLRQAATVRERNQLLDLHRETKDVLRAQVRQITEAAGSEDESKRSQLEPDIVFAVDANGVIVAQLGPLEANPPGGGLSTFPLVRRALLGYVRDDVWVYDRRGYGESGEGARSLQREADDVARFEVGSAGVASFCRDRGFIDFDLPVGDVDDPVARDAGGGIDALFGRAVEFERAVGDFGDHGDVGGTGVTIIVVLGRAADDSEIRFGFEEL
jgi:hypothetical protein